jgi:transcription antitermination factor NusG
MPSVASIDCPPIVYTRSGRDFPPTRMKIKDGKPRYVGKRPWRMALVKNNFDRSFAWRCKEHRIIYFLPMKTRTVKVAGRETEGMQVLFPGYVFFKANDNEFYTVKRFREAYQLVDLPDQLGVHRQMEKLFRALSLCEGLVAAFPLGHSVAIVAGPLEGLKAKVIAHFPDSTEVSVAVPMAFGTAKFRLPADNLALVPGPVPKKHPK